MWVASSYLTGPQHNPLVEQQLTLHFILCTSIKKVNVLPAPMAHRAPPISVSVALGHASVNAVKATVGGWSTGSSACLISPLLSHLSSARREGSERRILSLWYDSARA